MAEANFSLSERLSLLFGHLGIRRAHVAGAMSEVVEQGFEELRAGRKMKLLVDPTA